MHRNGFLVVLLCFCGCGTTRAQVSFDTLPGLVIHATFGKDDQMIVEARLQRPEAARTR